MEGTDSTNSGREKRRYARLPIQLDALVALGPRPPIACVVKDFCIAGVFIQIDMRQLRFVQPRTPATLHFTLTLDGVNRDFQLALSVCRVTGSGLGVAFKNPDPKVLGLLAGLAQHENSAPLPQTAADLSDTQRRFVPEFARVLPLLSTLVEKSASQIVVDFLRFAADGLFIAARDARTNREQNVFIDAQAQLRKRNEAITMQVLELLLKGLAMLDNPLRETLAKPGEGLAKLSLIDKNEFEEFLTVSELVAELEGRFKEPLFDLGKRVSFMARREVDDHAIPIGPTVICNVVADALKGFITDLAVSGVVYQMLRKTLDSQLERLYAEFNQILIDHNILPKIDHEIGVKRTPGDAKRKTKPPVAERSNPGYRTTAPPVNLADTLGQLARSQPRGVWEGANRSKAGRRSGAYTQTAAAALGQTLPPSGHAAAHQGAAPAGYESFGPFPPGIPGYPPITGEQRAGQAPNVIGAAAPGFQAGPGVPQGSGIGLDATFSGFGYGPALGVGPSFQQAFSTAQSQLALRRQLAPGAGGIAGAPTGPAYSPVQVVDGLSQLQQALTATGDPELIAAAQVKERITEALQSRGLDPKRIGQAESDAIEIIVNLFQALLNDAQVDTFAKGNLKRLQGSVHKAALLDEEFFASTHHPLRQLLNRVSMLRLDEGAEGQRAQARVRELIDGLNMSFDRDVAVVDPVVSELDEVLHAQRMAYEDNVRSVVNACEDQQRVLRERRERTGAVASDALAQAAVPAELHRWITRAKAMRVGDRLLMNANTKAPYPVRLIWIGDDFNPYVLADTRGNKSGSLTLQQVAMYLRRGIIKLLNDEGEDAFERALYGVVNRLHGEVVESAALDTLTGLNNRKSFINAITPLLAQPQQPESGAVLSQVSIENLKAVNDSYGATTGDQLIKQISDQLKTYFDKKGVTLGRLGGSEWGVFWPRGGLQPAYRETQTVLEKLNAVNVQHASGPIQPKFIAGMAAADHDLAHVDPLLSAVTEACIAARAHSDMPVYVAGTESKQRKQLEQMMNYVAKAIDRERLALLFNEVRGIGRPALPAAHVVVSAEDRNGKLVPPNLFSQAAASTAHAYTVDLWTLRHTLKWMAAHTDELERFSAFIVPLSRSALETEDLANTVVNELMETAVPPAKICFEIEDKSAVAKLNETADLINTLREFGCQFILAEFGAGQANYEYLKELAVDFVSIQTNYIIDGKQDPKDFAIAKSINELAHFMGKMTIAKLPNDPNGLELLREMKVDFVHDTARITRLVMESDG